MITQTISQELFDKVAGDYPGEIRLTTEEVQELFSGLDAKGRGHKVRSRYLGWPGKQTA